MIPFILILALLNLFIWIGSILNFMFRYNPIICDSDCRCSYSV